MHALPHSISLPLSNSFLPFSFFCHRWSGLFSWLTLDLESLLSLRKDGMTDEVINSYIVYKVCRCAWVCPVDFVVFHLSRRPRDVFVTCLPLSSFRHVVLRSAFLYVKLRDVALLRRHCDRLLQKNGKGPTKPRRRRRTPRASYGKQMRKLYAKYNSKCDSYRESTLGLTRKGSWSFTEWNHK